MSFWLGARFGEAHSCIENSLTVGEECENLKGKEKNKAKERNNKSVLIRFNGWLMYRMGVEQMVEQFQLVGIAWSIKRCRSRTSRDSCEIEIACNVCKACECAYGNLLCSPNLAEVSESYLRLE